MARWVIIHPRYASESLLYLVRVEEPEDRSQVLGHGQVSQAEPSNCSGEPKFGGLARVAPPLLCFAGVAVKLSHGQHKVDADSPIRLDGQPGTQGFSGLR